MNNIDFKCNFCSRTFGSLNALRSHSGKCKQNPNAKQQGQSQKWYDSMKNLASYRSYDRIICTCKFCNKTWKTTKGGLKNHEKCCNKNPNRISGWRKGKHLSDEHKQKLSKKAIEHSYWEHRSRNPIIYESSIAGKMNLDSYWELAVAKRLDSMNVTWYRPKLSLEYFDNKGQKRYYCPDFFVKDYGCFIEVKSPYILKRQNANGKVDYIKSHYSFIQWIESEEECNTFVLQKKNYSGIPEKLVENFEHKVRIKQISKEHKVDKRTYRDDFINLKNKRWTIIQKSNIDFTKFGWVKEISKLFGIAENKAGKYIEKNFPDFYKNCYVRK